MERVSSTLTRQRTPTLVPPVGYRSACRLPRTPAFRPGVIRVRETPQRRTISRGSGHFVSGGAGNGIHGAARVVRHPVPGPAAAGTATRRGHGEIQTGHPRPGGHPAAALRPSCADQLPRDLGPAGSHRRVGNPLRQRPPGTHGATAARDALLAQLGFTGVTFFPDAPNNVEHADQDSVRGYVLSNGIDANGRMIGFIYPGDPAEPDGAQVFLDNPRVDTSINATLLTAGLVYRRSTTPCPQTSAPTSPTSPGPPAPPTPGSAPGPPPTPTAPQQFWISPHWRSW